MKLSFALAAAVAAFLLGQPAIAEPATPPIEALSVEASPTSYVQFRRFGHRHHGFQRGYGYGRGSGYRRGPGVGAAVGAGVVGLATGAIIRSAIANSQAQATKGAPGSQAVAACARRFRSYDASSGSYLGTDGDRHACP
ncbi:BA14K family protein [Methylobacterium sp. WL9]|uniref:BA14K family protein n=1 Tax=Methylobacterium sp. WL9 TaxID=2603898 RepID=UPI0011CA7088|nr:BA14K family protein [Methylobacterium sp. WL9]TXN21129.1 BA14K family protein [Methylobacterium sp. WL9]